MIIVRKYGIIFFTKKVIIKIYSPTTNINDDAVTIKLVQVNKFKYLNNHNKLPGIILKKRNYIS